MSPPFESTPPRFVSGERTPGARVTYEWRAVWLVDHSTGRCHCLLVDSVEKAERIAQGIELLDHLAKIARFSYGVAPDVFHEPDFPRAIVEAVGPVIGDIVRREFEIHEQLLD